MPSRPSVRRDFPSRGGNAIAKSVSVPPATGNDDDEEEREERLLRGVMMMMIRCDPKLTRCLPFQLSRSAAA